LAKQGKILSSSSITPLEWWNYLSNLSFS